LHIRPTNTLESHPGGANPTSVIAGLQQVLTRLIEITATPEQRERWRGMLATVMGLDDATIRRFGLGSMLLGLFLLYLAN
ncbi:MAG: DUF2065 family protein, partial [Chromatocurvus sp.]